MTGLPGLIVAGVPKAGTSSVFDWLADHPGAVGSDVKETCFFADPGTLVFRPDFHILQGLDRYAAAWSPGPPGLLRVEATPSYIYSATALRHIPGLPGAPKCLFILREPAAQIRSCHTYFRNTWDHVPADMGFADYIAALRAGTHDFGGNDLARDALRNAVYADWLRPWRDALGPDRMRVMLFEDLRRDPRAFMAAVAEWCGLDPSFYDGYGFPASNESYAVVNRRLQAVNIALRDRLPKGALYRAARALYRRINTRRPAPDDGDAAIMAELRAEFVPANAALARDFGLDLSAWGQGPQATRAS